MSNAIAKVERWQVVHDELVRNGRQRAALDADEARWLREAEQLQIWKPFGMVSMVDYLERVLGYAPRTSQQRMSVARALADLPELTTALASGELPFSAIRELTRVATPHTEGAWRAAAQDKNLREIEQLVSGHKPGDLPTDAPDDDARLHAIRLDEVSAAAYGLWRQARQTIDRGHGSHANDDTLVRVLASAILDGVTTAADHGRAKNQIQYTVCQVCDRAWQDAAGAQVRVDAATLAQVRCDAQHLPSDPTKRATQDIPPRVRREIFRRDHGACQTPGCRSSWGLEIHHIIARADGGTHDPWNTTLRCGACHRAHHFGLLTISGTAPDHLTTTRTHAISKSAPHHRAPVDGPPLTASGAHVGAHTVPTDTVPTDTGSTTTAPTTSVPTNDAPNVAPTNVALTNTVLTDDKGASVDAPDATTKASISRLDSAIVRTNAIAALTASGWRRGIASTAVDAACAHVGAGAPLEVLLREAFRRCPTHTG